MHSVLSVTVSNLNAGEPVCIPTGEALTHVPPYASQILCEYFNLHAFGDVDTFDFPAEALALLADNNNPTHYVVVYLPNPNATGDDATTAFLYTIA